MIAGKETYYPVPGYIEIARLQGFAYDPTNQGRLTCLTNVDVFCPLKNGKLTHSSLVASFEYLSSSGAAPSPATTPISAEREVQNWNVVGIGELARKFLSLYTVAYF